jgi:hypothetical protein
MEKIALILIFFAIAIQCTAAICEYQTYRIKDSNESELAFKLDVKSKDYQLTKVNGGEGDCFVKCSISWSRKEFYLKKGWWTPAGSNFIGYDIRVNGGSGFSIEESDGGGKLKKVSWSGATKFITDDNGKIIKVKLAANRWYFNAYWMLNYSNRKKINYNDIKKKDGEDEAKKYYRNFLSEHEKQKRNSQDGVLRVDYPGTQENYPETKDLSFTIEKCN